MEFHNDFFSSLIYSNYKCMKEFMGSAIGSYL